MEAAGFDVFVTADRNLGYQQTLAGRAFGVLVIFPRRLKIEYIIPLVPALRAAVERVRPGEVIHVYPPLRPG